MITLLSNGDLFTCGTDAIVNTINCVGVMGKGLALSFKQRYPAMFRAYADACSSGEVEIGKMWIWYNQEPPRYIFNFPTKLHWRNPSQLSWIEKGLDDLRLHVIMKSIESLALPALGCTNGGLSFADVRPLVEQKLGDLDCRILLFEPQ